MEGLSGLTIEWGIATRRLAGESQCGDCHLVKMTADRVVIAAVDGLGHGRRAAEAAKRAVDVIEAYAYETPRSLVKLCHEQLRDTRGVAMSLATVDRRDGTLEWVGVGNVEGWILRADPSASQGREQMLLRGGIVGSRVPPLIPTVSKIGEDDILVFATDGVERRFSDSLTLQPIPQQLAEDMLNRHWTGSDDALVLVVRFGARKPWP